MKRSVLLVVGCLALIAAFLLGGRSTSPAAAVTPSDNAGVVVDGTGEATGAPDVLRLTMGVNLSGVDVSQALSRANAVIARIDSQLRRHGAKQADLQTSNVSIYPQDTKRGRSYQVSEQLTAKLHDLKGAGAAISDAVTAGGGGVTLDGVSFELEDNVSLLDSARDKAYADARRKAERYANLSGAHLGKVQLIAETVQAPAVPQYKGAFGSAGALSSAQDAVPLDPGSSQLSVRVTVRWALT